MRQVIRAPLRVRALMGFLASLSAFSRLLDAFLGWTACFCFGHGDHLKATGETVGSFGGGEPARAYKCARCGSRVWR
jgi:hypothetical protein